MPVPEALATIERYRVPGVVSVLQGEIEKKIFIKNGMIHFATSNVEDDRLGEYLLYRGIITQDQYDESVRQLKAGKGRQGNILVSMGAITPKDLYVRIREQVRDIVFSVFAWKEGTLNFYVGLYKDEELIKLNISIRKAILEGIKTVKDARFLISRLGMKTTLFAKVNHPEDEKSLDLSPKELELLGLIDGKRPLVTLVTKGPMEPEENAKVLYAFLCLRMIERVKEKGIIKIQVKS